MPPAILERTGYISSFPDLIGSVLTFKGNNSDHRKLMDMVEAGGDWTKLLESADINLCPAACHPLYPTLAGTMPEGGRIVEPAPDPGRPGARFLHPLLVGRLDDRLTSTRRLCGG